MWSLLGGRLGLLGGRLGGPLGGRLGGRSGGWLERCAVLSCPAHLPIAPVLTGITPLGCARPPRVKAARVRGGHAACRTRPGVDSQVLDLAGPSFIVPCTLFGAVDCKIHPSIHARAQVSTLQPQHFSMLMRTLEWGLVSTDGVVVQSALEGLAGGWKKGLTKRVSKNWPRRWVGSAFRDG
jgi:hypothetical protein